MHLGIDIYEGDNISNWDIVRQQVEVVIQKATQGTGHTDSLLKIRYPLIKQANLKIGFYHFANNSGAPESEAQFFLNTINGFKSDTVLWLDIEAEENWSKQAAIIYANSWVNYVQSKGFKTGIYTGLAFYDDYLKGNITNNHVWWFAAYGKQPSYYPNSASWQYSETGKLNGVVGNVDMDYFIDDIFIDNTTSAPPVLAPLPSNFNEAYYLEVNTDVANAVAQGQFTTGAEHYQKYGYKDVPVRKYTPLAIINYAAYVQNKGLQGFQQFNQIAGTVGEGLRMEGLTINYSGAGTLTFEGHVQDIGWQSVRNNGEFIGTIGECLRLEAIKIHLEDSPMKLSYSAHVENIGWMPYVGDNEIAGTVGQGLRLEAIKIRLE